MPERLSNSYSHHLQPIIVLYEPSTLSHPLTIAMLFNYALASLALTSCAYATPLKTIVTRQAVVTADALATANAALTPPMPPNVASSGPATPVVDMEKLMADIGNDPALGSLSAADRSDWRDVLKISAPGKICLADIVDHFLGGLPFQLGGCNGNSVGTMCSDDSQTLLGLLNLISKRTNRLASQSGGLADGARTPGTDADSFDPISGLLRVALVTDPVSAAALDLERTNDVLEPGNAPVRGTGAGRNGGGAGRNGEGAGRNGEGAGRKGEGAGRGPRPDNASAPGGAQRRPTQSVGSEESYGSTNTPSTSSPTPDGLRQDVTSPAPAAAAAVNADGSASENTTLVV